MKSDEAKDFVAWAQDRGATRVAIGDVEVEFPPRDPLATAQETLQALTEEEREMLRLMSDEERQEHERKRFEQLNYGSSY